MRSFHRVLGGLLAGAAAFSLCGTAAYALEGAPGPGVTAPSAILVEQATLAPLFERDADTRRAPASITKIMTMLLVMEALDAGSLTLEDPVTCSEYASSMGGSQIWLEPYEQMTVHELLKATAVASANDAAVALGEHLAGSEAAFVERMNRRAQELGLQNTHFVNCTGLDEEGHYTCARDIAAMAAELLKHPRIVDYTSIWMDELRGGETQLVNTNKLVYHYPGATGLKTGSTDNAGKCLCASAERSGMKLISVVLGAPNADTQFGDSTRLLDWGFGNFVSAKVALPPEELAPLRVLHGVQPEVELYAEEPEAVVIPRDDEGKLAYEVTLNGELTAPVENNQTVGRVVVHVDSREICTFPVKTKQAVAKMTFPRALHRLWRGLLAMGAADGAAVRTVVPEP